MNAFVFSDLAQHMHIPSICDLSKPPLWLLLLTFVRFVQGAICVFSHISIVAEIEIGGTADKYMPSKLTKYANWKKD